MRLVGTAIVLTAVFGVALAQDAPPADSVRYEVVFGDIEDEMLATALRDASNLVQLEEETPPSPIGLVRRAEADLARLAEVLGGLGYYNGTVGMSIAGRPLGDPELPDDLAALPSPVTVRIDVNPGAVFVFDRVTIEDAEGGGPPEVPVSTEGLGLDPGEPAIAATILAAEASLIAQMQAQGRPLARIAGRDAAVDPETATMDLTEYLDPGPLAGFGFVAIEGNKDVDTDFIASRIPFAVGDTYDPEAIRALREDLIGLGVFNSVRIEAASALDENGNLPLTLTVGERPPRFIGFGASYSTDQGFGVNGYWGHRNLFGGAESIRIDAVISGIGENDLLEPNASLSATFRKPGFIWREQTLTADLEIARTIYDAYTFTGVTGFVGVEHEWTDEITLTGGIRGQVAQVEIDGQPSEYAILAVPLGAAIDTTDNPLDATEGYKLDLDLVPTVGFGDAAAPYLITRAAGSIYFDPLGDGSLVLSARASIGGILGGDIDDVPPQERFYAGGTETVRGYAFQSIGPKDEDGLPTGGLSLVTAGIEARYKFTETIGAVAFLEGGGVFESPYPDFQTDMRYAAGVGARYYTSIGPIRLDVAVPLNPDEDDDAFQIYISLGQAF